MRRLWPFLWTAICWAPVPFWIRVTDEATGRGVPLVELRTMNELAFYTDSNGVAVIDEPGLAGQRVRFNIRSHGYEFRQKVFDEPGAILTVVPGERAELKIRRIKIAERLYRITGEGIYRDSVLAGLPVPLKRPLLNGLVLGQDTAIVTPYQGKLFWCWGDTIGPAHMNFSVSCATSEMPGKGGLDPAVGIDLTYFVQSSGFTKPMLKLPRPGLVWLEGLFTVKDDRGRERLVATYTRQRGLTPPEERGIAVFNDSRQSFEVLKQFPSRRQHRSSHPFRVTEHGKTYWYLYENQRVPDDWKAIQDPKAYESIDAQSPLIDADTGKPSGARPSSVAWNDYRQKWIMLAERTGDVYYAEAGNPAGPWLTAKRIVAHDHYNFYNVVQHPFFNQEGGRVIYFEGTYTDSFSGAKAKTPRYNYNQIMYRLRLDSLAPKGNGT